MPHPLPQRPRSVSLRARNTALVGLCLLSAAARAQAPLAPGGAHYTISQNGKPLGEATYAVASIPNGYTITSSGHMSLAKFTYSFHHQASLDASLNLVTDTLGGAVNGTRGHAGNIEFNTASSPSGRDFQIDISADGKQTTNSIDRHRNTVLVPDLVPGAYALMARLAMAQPQSAWVLIPKENGLLVPAAYQLRADVAATLNGRATSVKHATAQLSDANSITLELYYTASGQLMEADLNAQNLYVIHDGFKLVTHPAPTPPPPGQPPAQPGTDQGQGTVPQPQVQ
ncbi:MAG TPA: hypothetical protein VGD62_10320 [Acidobacteriaceae bacterium]